MESPSLIAPLTALRAKIRRLLVMYGVCVVIAWTVVSFLTIVTLDWLLWLPSVPRMILAGLLVVSLVAAMHHWIVRPLRVRITLPEIAGRLEQHFGLFRDRLTSAVDFLEGADDCSETLKRRAVTRAERAIEGVPLKYALTLRPLARRALLAAASTTVLVFLCLAAPQWVGLGFYRYAYPLEEREWPRSVSIVPQTRDLRVPIGESVTVRMQVRRGLSDRLRSVVHIREVGGDEVVLAMRRGADGAFSVTIDAVTQNLEYWFEAGDDTTNRKPFRIDVVRRPEVLEALGAIHPPPYAKDSPVRTVDLADGPVRAVAGSTIRLTIRTNKPIQPHSPDNPVGLYGEENLPVAGEANSVAGDANSVAGEANLIPLAVDASDPQRLTASIDVVTDLRFRIRLADQHGFANRSPAEYSIVAVSDQTPSITILAPAALTEVTPNASIALLARVEDDFGVTDVALVVDQPGTDTRTFELTNQLVSDAGSAGVTTITHEWNLEPLSLSPGDLLSYWVTATDNRQRQRDNRIIPGETGQIGQSPTQHLKIISRSEFDTRLRSEMALLEERIRRTALDQAELLDRTESLLRSATLLRRATTTLTEDQPTRQQSAAALAEGELLSDIERETTATLAARQARLVRQLRGLGARFVELTERIERNSAADPQTHSRIVALADGLEQTATGPMTTAAGALDKAREHTNADEQQSRLIQATNAEEAALEGLHAMLAAMARWGSFRELLTKTQGLLDRQETLRTETGELGNALLGKQVDTLTDQQQTQLSRTARSQQQLTTDVEQLLTDMNRLTAGLPGLADAPEDKDAGSAEAIDAALRSARRRDVVKHMSSAAETIRSNRTAAAAMDQKAASDGLRKMLGALRERETRRLEDLRKRIDRAVDAITELIEQQQALRNATQEADLLAIEGTELEALAGQQRTLMRNTKQLGNELAVQERTAQAARPVSQAATPMRSAETNLLAKQAAAATANQDEALALLQDALDTLEELAREAADETLRRSLAQIREDLEAILAAQKEVNTEVEQLHEAVSQRGRVGRSEARTAAKLAHRQATVQTQVQECMPNFDQVVVYRWALDRVSEWMAASQTQLRQRDINDELITVTQRIARELEKLIQAIIDTESLPFDTQFAERDSGSSGGQPSATSNKPVPAVAELLVLKAMQSDINERTESFDKSMSVDRASESELRKLRILGEDQTQVRRLTELVTQRAENP